MMQLFQLRAQNRCARRRSRSNRQPFHFRFQWLEPRRLLAAGDLDLTFGGGDGMVATAIGYGDAEAYSVAVDQDGNYVVAGAMRHGSNYDFALTRYTSAGVLDTSFGGGDGIVTTDIASFRDFGYSVAVDVAGNYVVAGQAGDASNLDFALVRYTSAGVLDTSFGGGDGIVTTSLGSSVDFAWSVAVDAAGNYVVSGQSDSGSSYDFALARYTSSGVLDTSFGGGDGMVTTPIGSASSHGRSVAMDAAGNYVVAGHTYNGSYSDFAMARYTSSGVLDTSFGGGDGIVTTDVASLNDFGYSMAVDAAGNYVVAGYTINDSTYDFALARYTSDGVLDTSFGRGDGIVTTPIGSRGDRAYGVAVDTAGNYVVAGITHNGSNYEFALVRYQGDYVGTVSSRRVFYNASSFDAGDARATPADDAAIATDKSALLPGGTATVGNYTSYSRGINGVMVDIQNAADPGNITAADFDFCTGNDFEAWSAGPNPSSVTVRDLGGGISRVTLIWPDGEIVGQWLEVTVKSTANTGLAADDLFYFGNAPGDTADGNPAVNGTDFANVRMHPTSLFNPAAIDDPHDFNRDGRVNAADLIVVRDQSTTAASALKLISPAAPLAASVAPSFMGGWFDVKADSHADAPSIDAPSNSDGKRVDVSRAGLLTAKELNFAAIDRLMASLAGAALTQERSFDAADPAADITAVDDLPLLLAVEMKSSENVAL